MPAGRRDDVEDLAARLEGAAHGAVLDIAGRLLVGDEDGSEECARDVAPDVTVALR